MNNSLDSDDASAQVVETSFILNDSTTQDYIHLDDHATIHDMTPGFKPFTVMKLLWLFIL